MSSLLFVVPFKIIVNILRSSHSDHAYSTSYINATSSRLRGVIWFNQMVSIPAFIRVVYAAFSIGNYSLQLKIVQVLTAFYSFWNLDVLRSAIPDTCLNVSTVQALALKHLVALYPFVLITLSYIIIELYDRKFTLVLLKLW